MHDFYAVEFFARELVNQPIESPRPLDGTRQRVCPHCFSPGSVDGGDGLARRGNGLGHPGHCSICEIAPEGFVLVLDVPPCDQDLGDVRSARRAAPSASLHLFDRDR